MTGDDGEPRPPVVSRHADDMDSWELTLHLITGHHCIPARLEGRGDFELVGIHHRFHDATALRVIPDWGRPYGCDPEPAYLVQGEDFVWAPVWMYRKAQAVRFFDRSGAQVGPQQRNVAPAVAFAHHSGWVSVNNREERA